MANIQGPFGFRPVRRSDGAAPNYNQTPYLIAFNNSNTIARGDPVKGLSSGFIDVLAPGSTAILGILAGIEYVDPNFQRKVWLNAWKAPSLASGTVVLAYVWDDPNLIFEVQGGNASVTMSTPIGQGSVFNNANHAGQSTPTSAGISQAYLDQNSITTTNTLAFRIVGLSQKVGNDNTSAFNTVEVMFNFGQIRSTTGI